MSFVNAVRAPLRRAAVLSAAVAAVSLAGVAGADDHTWISREHGQFSDPANWLGGNVPASGADTFLTFTNLGHSSYRAFNDLGILNVGGITLETRTNTATFISVSAGSAYQFGDGSFIRSTDTGLFRFGGISGVPNDWRLVGNLTLDTQSYGNTYVAAPVSGAGSLTVTGSGPSELDGFFRLEGANTFTGGVTLQSGILEIGNASGLGTGVLTADGGIFRTSTSLTIANNIVANQDLLLRPRDSGFTLAGVISGPGGIDLRGVGDLDYAVNLTNANTYTGATVIDQAEFYELFIGLPGMTAGNIGLSGNGSIASSSLYDIRNGGELRFDNASNPGLDRLNDTAPMHLVNGRLSALGNNTAGNNTVERVGPVTIEGMAQFFINGRNGGMEVSTPSLTRGDRATIMMAQANTGAILSVDSAVPMVGGIVPWIAGSPSTILSPRDLVTYDGGQLRTLTAGEYATDLTAGASANVKLPGGSSGSVNTVENNDTVTVNALVVPDWTTVSGTGTVNVASGAVILANGTGTSFDNNIDFGAAEGILHIGSIVTMNGVISGSNGLTKSGDFSVTLTQPQAYTGVTTINGGGFRFTDPDTFDSTSGFVNRTAGGGELVASLDWRGAGTAVIDKPAEVASGAFRLAAREGGGNALEYAGVISGPGVVHLESVFNGDHGRLILSNDNTYTGGTRIVDAEVEINRDSNLGAPTGGLSIAGTVGQGIVLTGDWITSRPIRLLRSSTLTTNGFDAHWNGRLDSDASLTKLGAGTLRIAPDGIGNGGSSGWTIGAASSTDFTHGGRVEIDGDVRMNWTVWDGTLAVDGTIGRLSALSLGGSTPRLAPGDVDGPGAGTMEAFFMSLAHGTHIEFDLGSESDLLRSVTTLNRGSSGDGPVWFDFRVGEGADEATYTLIEYFENPSSSVTFEVSDFAFTSNIEGFDGFFDLVQFADGTRGLQFTVTAVPAPAGAIGAIGAIALLAGRRRA